MSPRDWPAVEECVPNFHSIVPRHEKFKSVFAGVTGAGQQGRDTARGSSRAGVVLDATEVDRHERLENLGGKRSLDGNQ